MVSYKNIARALLIGYVTLVSGCTPTDLEHTPLGRFDYSLADWSRCSPEQSTGPAGYSNDETLSDGHKFNVRTPQNYDPTRQHPLIVVYSPARYQRHRTEDFTGLTTAATQAGFVVAYVDSLRLSVPAIKRLSQVPMEVAKKWCIDKTRIYLTGHSDGGTVSNAIAFQPNMPFRPRAIAPSAAGIRADDMKEEQCASPLSVLTLHNSADKLFPGYGLELADWWAQCNKCSIKTKSPTAQCSGYTACLNDVETVICVGPGGHSTWPDANQVIIDFFTRT